MGLIVPVFHPVTLLQHEKGGGDRRGEGRKAFWCGDGRGETRGRKGIIPLHHPEAKILMAQMQSWLLSKTSSFRHEKLGS